MYRFSFEQILSAFLMLVSIILIAWASCIFIFSKAQIHSSFWLRFPVCHERERQIWNSQLSNCHIWWAENDLLTRPSQRQAHNIFNMWMVDGGWWSFFSLGFRELWKCMIQLLIGFGRPRLRCSKNNMHFNYREMFSCGNVCWDWIWTLDHIEFCLNVCYRFITM